MSRSFVVYKYIEGDDRDNVNIPVLHTEDYELADMTVQAYWDNGESNYAIAERSEFQVRGDL